MKKNIFFYVSLFFVSIPLHAENLEQLFTRIYQTKIWGVNEKGEGTSGGGSTLAAAKEYIPFVEKFIKEHNIKSVVDVGCGDWEFTQHMNWTGIDYIGYDIVQFVVEKNIQRFSAPNIQFIHGNIIDTNLPPADLLLCKDVLQHLGSDDIKKFIPQLKKYNYCLITNGPHCTNVYDIFASLGNIVFIYHGDEVKKIILIKNEQTN